MKAEYLIFAIAVVTKARAENQDEDRPKLIHWRRNIPLMTASSEPESCCTTVYFTSTGEGFLYTPPTPSPIIEAIPEPKLESPSIVSTSTATKCLPPLTVTVTETKYVDRAPEFTSTDSVNLDLNNPAHDDNVLASTTSVSHETPPSNPTPSNMVPEVPVPNSQVPVGPQTDFLGSENGMWAITFSPFDDNGRCKSVTEVWADVKMIRTAGFKSIRVYGTECSGIEHISSAASFHGMKLIVGIFIGESGCSGAAGQVTQIIEWGKWDVVELIVIGNEALFSGHASPEELASFIKSTKDTLRSAGYTGPCTTAEPLNVWQNHLESLCDAVDIVGCNIHPFFNPQIDASHAGPFVKSQLDIVENLCPGKHGINLECGWPSAGECNGKACPGKSEQQTAVASIQSFAGNRSVMFTYTNDYWKSPGAFKVEQNFGLIKLFASH